MRKPNKSSSRRQAGERSAARVTRRRDLTILKTDPAALRIDQALDETPLEARSRAFLRPAVQAGATIRSYNKGTAELSLNALVENLSKQCELASRGDVGRTEAMLMTQAHT